MIKKLNFNISIILFGYLNLIEIFFYILKEVYVFFFNVLKDIYIVLKLERGEDL